MILVFLLMQTVVDFNALAHEDSPWVLWEKEEYYGLKDIKGSWKTSDAFTSFKKCKDAALQAAKAEKNRLLDEVMRLAKIDGKKIEPSTGAFDKNALVGFSLSYPHKYSPQRIYKVKKAQKKRIKSNVEHARKYFCLPPGTTPSQNSMTLW